MLKVRACKGFIGYGSLAVFFDLAELGVILDGGAWLNQLPPARERKNNCGAVVFVLTSTVRRPVFASPTVAASSAAVLLDAQMELQFARFVEDSTR